LNKGFFDLSNSFSLNISFKDFLSCTMLISPFKILNPNFKV
jgi:hypothetical protein